MRVGDVDGDLRGYQRGQMWRGWEREMCFGEGGERGQICIKKERKKDALLCKRCLRTSNKCLREKISPLAEAQTQIGTDAKGPCSPAL